MALDELDILTLAEAAERLGVGADSLRHQVQDGRLRARKLGKTWITTGAEVERYRRENLGRVGRPMEWRGRGIFMPLDAGVLEASEDWLQRFGRIVRESTAAGDTEAELEQRLGPLAAERGAVVHVDSPEDAKYPKDRLVMISLRVPNS